MRSLANAVFGAVVVPLLVVGIAQAALTDDLEAYWSFDNEGDPTVATDHVGTVDLVAEGNAAFIGTGVAGDAATSGEELPFGSQGHSMWFSRVQTDWNLNQEMTISTWYRIDALGGTGEKSAIYQHGGRGLGFYNPDDFDNYFSHIQYNSFGIGAADVLRLGDPGQSDG